MKDMDSLCTVEHPFFVDHRELLASFVTSLSVFAVPQPLIFPFPVPS